jgi:DNA-directed RNA polymerase specialized sigma24 family protein
MLIDQPKEMAARDLNITLNNLTVRAHRARRALRDAVDSLPISYGGIAAASGR